MITSSSSSSSPTTVIPSTRGAFVLLEGVDRCGKTTQCRLLLKHLLSLGVAAISMQFPNRTTQTGKLIDAYLQNKNAQDDHAIHLLFSANRWEAVPTLKQNLKQGTSVVCDRYAYSGVAFSSAKVDKNDKPLLDIDWCKSPDLGLPAPDVVIFLDLLQNEAERRGGYGGERYEKREMQMRVREKFGTLKNMDAGGVVPWHVVNAAQSVEQVQEEINTIVHSTLLEVSQGKPLYGLWQQDKEIDLNQDEEQDDKEKKEDN